MLGTTSDHYRLDKFGKVWQVRNRTVGCGNVWIRDDFLSRGSMQACLSCMGKMPHSIDILQSWHMVGAMYGAICLSSQVGQGQVRLVGLKLSESRLSSLESTSLTTWSGHGTSMCWHQKLLRGFSSWSNWRGPVHLLRTWFVFFVSVIWPVLEYAWPIWHSNLTTGQCDLLESLQKRVLKIIFNDNDFNMSLILSGMDTLYSRTEHLIQRFYRQNILHSSSCLNYLLPEQPQFVNKLCRANKYKPFFN